ncbi:sorting nexin-21 [Perca flavescens]|uniref:sorting nexin-21 n=1 Tax=Perca flavescens TaxID=8167 RepID=UPI00106DF552|nr:sorting nexin-21 [Perca flavescens]
MAQFKQDLNIIGLSTFTTGHNEVPRPHGVPAAGRLKRSLFKDGQGAGPEQEAAQGQEEEELPEQRWEAELEEDEEEWVAQRLGGTLSFTSVAVGDADSRGEDSEEDFLGDSTEDGLSSTDISPRDVSPGGLSPASSSLLAVSPAGLSPAGLSPAGLSPAGLSPAGLSPAGLSPAGPSPAGLSPAGLSPAGLSPAGLSPAGLSPAGLSPADVSPASFLLTRQLQDSWRTLRRLTGGSNTSADRQLTDNLLFEVTDASVVTDSSSKYVLYTIHVIQSGGSDKTPAIITRRYSDFQRLHATLRRNHGDQMERVCFPRKKLHRNFTAETIARRSRAFEQYLSHLCSLPGLRGALCVRHFFYLTDLQTAQLLIRGGHFPEALGPLLNAKRLQHKLGWTGYQDDRQALAPPPASSHWLFTLVGLWRCFQEAEQLEEAWHHCDAALRVITPTEDKPRPLTDRPHPLLLPLLRAVVRLSWQTGRDKRRWEELLQQLGGQGAGLDNQPIITEFLLNHNLQESEWEG